MMSEYIDKKFQPRLQAADPWDGRTGHRPVTDFMVDCTWIPVNEDWALLSPTITLHDGVFKLCKDAEVFRVRRDVGGRQVESPLLSATAWTKRALGSGGVKVLALHERNPGHMTDGKRGSHHFRWYASVASRLSVAVVRLDGSLEGQARLAPVE